MKRFFILPIAAFLLTGCGVNTHSPGQVAAASGAAGGALGAGTGAIIGAVISNGNIGMSALTGGLVGIPIGAGLGYVYVKQKNARELGKYDDQIEQNRQEILQADEDIHNLRRNAIDESFVIEPDQSRREELYLGPTLGNPYR